MKILKCWVLYIAVLTITLFFLPGICQNDEIYKKRSLSRGSNSSECVNLYSWIDQNDVTAFKQELFQTEMDGLDEVYSIDVNMSTGKQGTLLMYVVTLERADFIQAVLERKDLDINQKSESGDTALHYAVLTENVRIVSQLLDDYRINPRIKNYNGHTARHYARRKEIKKLLDEHSGHYCILI